MSQVRFRLGNIYLSNLTKERGIHCATQPSIVICKFLHGMTSSKIFGRASEASIDSYIGITRKTFSFVSSECVTVAAIKRLDRF